MSLSESIREVCLLSRLEDFLGVHIGSSASMMTMTGMRDAGCEPLEVQYACWAAQGLDVLSGCDRMPTWDALHMDA